jgi:dTDP-4-amino-4,6-dideoxygalactose transaminase
LDWSELQACWEKVRDSEQWTEGYYVKALEDAVSKRYNLHAIAVNSAGTGLYAMLRVAKELFNPWGITAIQNNTFFATGAMVREAGYPIRLLDCKITDFSMDFAKLAAQRDIGVVVLTHIGGGLAADYAEISKYCHEKGILLLEDAAHALGAQDVEGRLAGQRSDGAVFSLYPTKAVPVGEGGIIVTSDALFAEWLRKFRNYGKSRDSAGTIRYDRSGFNFRMDEWTAAIGYLQLKRLDEIMMKRADAAWALHQIIKPITRRGGVSNWYKYPVRLDEAMDAAFERFTGRIYSESDQLVTALGIGRAEDFPGCRQIAATHCCLPLDEDLYANMTEQQVLAYLRGD